MANFPHFASIRPIDVSFFFDKPGLLLAFFGPQPDEAWTSSLTLNSFTLYSALTIASYYLYFSGKLQKYETRWKLKPLLSPI